MGAKAGKLSTPTRRLSKSERSNRKTSNEPVAVLTETDYVYLTDQTKLSRGEIKEIYDKFVKESTDGELNLQEFVEFYSSLSTEVPQFLEDYSQFIFDSFDKDHNGKISFREFLIAYVLTSPGNLEKKINYTFDLYDMDNNGYLDPDEVYRVVSRIFDLLDGGRKSGISSKVFAEQCLSKLDVNPKDGIVSREEYVNGLINNPDLRVLLTPFN